jgi:hypothetical protein
MSFAYNPAAWSSFFSAQVSASAALVGLLFVAVSINLAKIVESRQLVARSAKALFTVTGILLASTLCLVPGQRVKILGCELAVVGMIVFLATTLAGRAASLKNPFITTRDRVVQAILSQLSSAPMVVAGVLLFGGRGGGLYWLVGAIVFSFIAALIDAWVLLIEINR